VSFPAAVAGMGRAVVGFVGPPATFGTNISRLTKKPTPEAHRF
jgi:hypothetical protein